MTKKGDKAKTPVSTGNFFDAKEEHNFKTTNFHFVIC